MFANLLSFFFNHKNAQPLFFLHLSTSGTVNNIKIIYSIRFSLLITINRFYKLFLVEDAFVNRRPETIPPLFHTARTLFASLRSPPSPRGEGFVSEIPLPPSNLRPFGAPPSIGRREYPREPLPLEGAAERSEAGLVPFFWRRSRLLFAFPTRGRLCRGNGILVSSSIPRKNDRLLRAVVFMCITCLGKRPCRLHLRIADGRKEVVEVAGTLREKGS